MERWLWNQSHTQYALPSWRCPTCHQGNVRLVPKSFEKSETTNSKKYHSDEDWYPGDTDYIYSAWGECSNEGCKERFSISGIGGVEQTWDSDGDTDWTEFFRPVSCVPMPNIIDIPRNCPGNVAKELKSAFALFWMSRAASAGRIRVALEYLLDHLKIDREATSRKDGKKVDLTLHRRIEILAETDQANGELMEAVKWLANTGTHEDEVPQQSLLEAFEIIEHLLVEVIESRTAKVAEKAKKMIEKFKPK